MDNLHENFCAIDDFVKNFWKEWTQRLISSGERKRIRKSRLSPSEIMTIVVAFHSSNYRTFKHFYLNHVCRYWKEYFPNLVSYSQFVRLKQSVLMLIYAFLISRRGEVTGISYIDSTPISVCKNIRINRHKTFSDLADLGKTSVGWFYGFKLHLVVNDKGEILSFYITAGNVNDRKPLKHLVKNIKGKLFGDRGYISKKLTSELFEQGLHLITTIKKNMKNKLMLLSDKILLRKRYIIETINDQLKNISQVEHSRHRSFSNFLVNILGGLASYVMKEKKPKLNLWGKELMV